MDIETINFNYTQVPVVISSCGGGAQSESKIFLIYHLLLQKDVESAVYKLWSPYLESSISSHSTLIICRVVKDKLKMTVLK